MKSQHSLQINVMDQNDSPSTPRTVDVLVYHLAGTKISGKIADVHPNDADTTGDYQCKVIYSKPSDSGLVVRHGCELSVDSNLAVGERYQLTVSGNDGRHTDVTSKVFVQLFTFDNATIDNSFTIRVENMTGPKFLTHYYENAMVTMKQSFDSSTSIQLISIQEVDSGVQLTVAVKGDGGYVSRAMAVEKLAENNNLQRILDSAVTIGYSPCQRTVCENDGGCSDGIRVSERETRITDSQTVIFTSPVVWHDFTCRCPDGFTGKLCERRHDPCVPNPCQANGVCQRHQGYDLSCTCPPNREGQFCEIEKGNACDRNPCLNGGSCRSSQSNYFCLCRPGYRGNHCETAADSCRPNSTLR